MVVASDTNKAPSETPTFRATVDAELCVAASRWVWCSSDNSVLIELPVDVVGIEAKYERYEEILPGIIVCCFRVFAVEFKLVRLTKFDSGTHFTSGLVRNYRAVHCSWRRPC